jgi:hypothetical protein
MRTKQCRAVTMKCCATFLVHRDLVRSRPKSFYKAIYDEALRVRTLFVSASAPPSESTGTPRLLRPCFPELIFALDGTPPFTCAQHDNTEWKGFLHTIEWVYHVIFREPWESKEPDPVKICPPRNELDRASNASWTYCGHESG